MDKYILPVISISIAVVACIIAARAKKKEAEVKKALHEETKKEASERANTEFKKAQGTEENNMYSYASQYMIRCIMDLVQHSALNATDTFHTTYAKGELVQELESMGLLDGNAGIKNILERYGKTNAREYSRDDFYDLERFIRDIEEWYEKSGIEFPLMVQNGKA